MLKTQKLNNMKTVKDSTGKEYLQTDSGTCYNVGTDVKVIDCVENAQRTRQRVRVWFGDVSTGKSWNEENDVCGYIGRSTGAIIKVPLLVSKSNSYGGGILLSDCIVKMVDTKTGRELYKHANFSQSVFTVTDSSDLKEYTANVLQDGSVYARCKKMSSAQRLADFMNGKRMNK
jgi:hypothetical protein